MRDTAVLKAAKWNPSIVTASFVANLLTLAVPLALLQIYDRVIPNAAHETLIVLGVMVVFALITDSALRMARARLLSYFAAEFEARAMRGALWAIVMEDPSHRKRADHGTLVTRMSSIDRLRGYGGNSAAVALLDLPFAMLFLAVIAIFAPLVAMTVAAMLALTFLILMVLRRRVEQSRAERLDIEARRYSFFSEVLGNIRSLRALDIIELMCRRQERLLERSSVQTKKLTRNFHAAQGLTAAIGSLTPIVTAAVAGYLVLNGEASIGVLAAVVLLSSRIVQPVLRLEGYLAELDSVQKAEEDLKTLLDAPLKPGGTRHLDRVRSLDLQEVSTHPDSDLGLGLDNITVSLRPGDCLLLRSDDPVRLIAAERLFLGEARLSAGTMTVNDRPVIDYRLRDRQNRMRILAEDVHLLDGTLFDNICAFDPDRNGPRALELAEELGLRKILRPKPRGLLTQVRPDSTDIPQSARRIAANIAALVTQPDVIVFRAAYSGLDHETDQKMLEWLKGHASRHILILSTNRPSYAKLATKTLNLSPSEPAWMER